MSRRHGLPHRCRSLSRIVAHCAGYDESFRRKRRSGKKRSESISGLYTSTRLGSLCPASVGQYEVMRLVHKPDQTSSEPERLSFFLSFKCFLSPSPFLRALCRPKDEGGVRRRCIRSLRLMELDMQAPGFISSTLSIVKHLRAGCRICLITEMHHAITVFQYHWTSVRFV